ncbi:hypothetical protein ARHIZOSPH14_10460 [Agromyces rhizosphaerae]|uniref:Uncharacterized protein n=1 Tax=Agromyces rhizosphaerae TaxID=88374 RepID=A0A9W6FNB8_9MICO|nr:hypothetical protein [Agromyces rhizosphaerae]GLI26804.1 hypothetical protein ARHIZOSPH14_10460 [Agromyces rhizosphaerae]
MEFDDELGALRERRRALEAVVYGTPDGFSSDAAGELSEVLARIAELERGSTAATTASERRAPDSDAAETEAPGADELLAGLMAADAADDRAAGDDDDRPTEPPGSGTRRGRGIRRALIAGVAAIAVGAWFAVTLTPPPGTGLAVFEREQVEADLLPMEAFLGASARATTRLVDEELGYGFWAFRDRDGRVCLIMLQPDTIDGADADCAEERTFLAGGLSLVLAFEDVPERLRPAGMRMGEVLRIIWTADADGVVWTMDADA